MDINRLVLWNTQQPPDMTVESNESRFRRSCAMIAYLMCVSVCCQRSRSPSSILDFCIYMCRVGSDAWFVYVSENDCKLGDCDHKCVIAVELNPLSRIWIWITSYMHSIHACLHTHLNVHILRSRTIIYDSLLYILLYFLGGKQFLVTDQCN